MTLEMSMITADFFGWDSVNKKIARYHEWDITPKFPH
ncbi:hypothetical protein PS865_03407 [Pseudomonas fluorescens]|nr:hypothetical protein PS865_03407 [Pseudomonas fluorescens]